MAARLAIATKAGARAQELSGTIADIQIAGIISFSGIARELAARGVPTERGGRWAATQVRDLLLRRRDREKARENVRSAKR
jgi:Recombinase